MYTPNFLCVEDADDAFEELRDCLSWERRENAPRSEYWTNIYNRPYTYGHNAGQRTYQAQPSQYWISVIAGTLYGLTRTKMFEGCFLNMYQDGSDALGWHADDDAGIDHSRPIAVVTLGQARRIQWKEQTPGSHPQEQLLEHGSLFLMPAGFQQTHFHRIPRDLSAGGARISLTYRGLI